MDYQFRLDLIQTRLLILWILLLQYYLMVNGSVQFVEDIWQSFTIPKVFTPLQSRAGPPPNYLSSIPNAIGVTGLGFLWIKEISVAIGTPILAPILIPPLIILAIALIFIPDFTSIGYANFIEAAAAFFQ